MTSALEKNEVAAAAATPTAEAEDASQAGQASPARSDKSSDSEGKPVRDKLKETRIDAQNTNPADESDQHMKDVPNGSAKVGEQSASGSDSERGRVRRKRSREDFEDEVEAEKQSGKKIEAGTGRHVRKKSRDISKDDMPTKPAPSTIPRIEEHDTDEQMTSPNKNNATLTASDKTSGVKTSPQNKRTRDQAETDPEAVVAASESVTTNGAASKKTEEERDTKRLRDKDDSPLASGTAESKTKIPPGSGFANISTASPFAAMSPKPLTSKGSDKPDSLPQTSDDKFKSSGFGGFASSAASPFGGFSSTKTASSSPFGAASTGKLSSFAGSKSPAESSGSGFGALGGSTKPTFGGSTFGGSSGFGGFGGGAKPTISSFATPGSTDIQGLKVKRKDFGAAALGQASDDEDADASETEKDGNDEERQSSQPLLSQQPHETGEEGEVTVWTGRAKLYTMAGEVSNRGWQERGSGNFKLNITVDEPKKARFVLRADGTHRLLLNAAVTKKMAFGGNHEGEKPKDTRLLFNTPTTDGGLEMHLLKLKAENAVKLWEEVTKVQEREL